MNSLKTKISLERLVSYFLRDSRVNNSTIMIPVKEIIELATTAWSGFSNGGIVFNNAVLRNNTVFRNAVDVAATSGPRTSLIIGEATMWSPTPIPITMMDNNSNWVLPARWEIYEDPGNSC